MHGNKVENYYISCKKEKNNKLNILEFSADQMATDGGEIVQTSEPIGSVLPKYQPNENHSVGKPWSTGLFDCHENQTNAVLTAFLPCLTLGQIAEVLEGGKMACHMGTFIYLLTMPALCSQWMIGSKYRRTLRNKFGLVEAPYTDIISHIFCPCCSLCQEFRELKIRGLDPAIGWNGILAKQQHEDQTAEAPPQTQAMSK